MVKILKKYTAIFFVLLFSLCGCAGKNGENTPVFSDSQKYMINMEKYSRLSNKLLRWGFRKTEERPYFTPYENDLMKKNDCIYMGNKKKKYLYLTFDEGYEKGYTSIILDVLREKGVPAAFFVTAQYVKSEPELIKRMAKEGHIIGNHTVNHPSMPSVCNSEKIVCELYELDKLIYDACKKKCKYFRPPMGEYSERVLAIVKDLGYTSTFWSLAYVDWDDKKNANEAEKAVLSQLHEGAVILLHAVSKGNAEALGNIIEKAQKEGYSFKSLDEYEA